MQYIQNIPDFDEKLREKLRIVSDKKVFRNDDHNNLQENYYEIINTKINSNDVEKIISTVLDKYSDTCKYFINIDEAYFGVSFNVSYDQFEIMSQSMFELRLYKDKNNNTVICLTKEITEFHQWSDIYKSLLLKLKM